MTPIEKLEQHLLDNGDIGIPVGPGDSWVLMDEDDNEIAFGDSLENAAKDLNYGN